MRHAIIGAVALSFAPAINTFAIEGLTLSVPATNVVLSWPSDPSETYLIQYRHTLDATDSWTTIADFYPPDYTGLNITYFYDTNIDYGAGGSGGSAGGGGSMMVMSTMQSQPLAMPNDGSGDAVPLSLYPLGFDLSNFLIFDPASSQWVSGASYSADATASSNSGLTPLAGPIPLGDGSGGGGGSTVIPGTGFYRVVRDGMHIFGLTNGVVLSGTVEFPIEMGLASTDEIIGVVFYDENSNPIIGATGDGSGNGWKLTWNTLAAENGTYNLYAEVDYASDPPDVSIPVSVTVSNVISFPNYFSQIFGGQMWVYAETVPNATYTLDMYDENTNYIGTFADSADANGVISFLWDLIDPGGSPDTNTNFLGVFTVDTSSLPHALPKLGAPNFQAASPAQKTMGITARPNGPQPNSGGSSATGTNTWALEPAWYPTKNWAIAYSPLNPDDSVSTLRIQEMMIGGDGGEYGGVVSTLGFYGLGAPMSPGNVSQSSAFEMADPTTRTNFLSYMAQTQYRNFYFFGHGSASGFGTTGAVITDRNVQNDLGNFMHTAKPLLNHPYRFVFIDGCLAGSGKICEDFGIPAFTTGTNYFATLSIWSRAFLGFQKTVSFDSSQWTWRAEMLNGFFNDWMNPNNSLYFCVSNAQQQAGQPLDSTAVIFGAADMNKNSVP